MTVDDENSIYVGGLPSDCSEDTIRSAFDLYGAIVAVKIVNDRDFGGKCYCFVTYNNPRCAVDAISDMNGREVAGRVVRVNEVKTRGGRPNFNRGNSRRDVDRSLDWDRDRDRERDPNHGRERYRDRSIGRSRDRDRQWETEYEQPRGQGRSKDRFLDEDRDQDQDRENNEQGWSRKEDRDLTRDLGLDWDREKEVDRTKDHDRRENDKDQQLRNQTGSHIIGHRSRELSSNSSDGYQDQVKEQLQLSVQKREELQEEISQLQENLDERGKRVSDLQKKSLKLEDALVTAKKLSSQRRMQLTKFQRCILQVNDYTVKLKSSEQELQSLVDTVMVESDDVEDAAIMDGSISIIGKA